MQSTPTAPSKPTQSAQPIGTITPQSRVETTPPLLGALSILFKVLGSPKSPEALVQGLPQASAFPPSLCIRAAEQNGMSAKVVKRAGLNKISPLTLPCILLLKNDNACVLTALTDRQASVIFPENESTTHTLSIDDLAKEYTGYTIFGGMKAKMDNRVKEMRFFTSKSWFWGTIFRFFPIYRHVITASVVINLLALASPLFVMNVYDRVVPNSATHTLWVLATGVAIAFFFDFLLRNLRGYFVDVAGKNADVIIASRLIQHVMSMRLDARPESTGTLANNLRDFESLREFFSSSTLLAIVDLPFVAVFLVFIHFLGGPLVFVPLAAIPIVLIVGVIAQYPFQKIIQQGARESAQKNALLVEMLGGIEAIKANIAEGELQAKWEKMVGANAATSARSKSLAHFSITFSTVMAQLVSMCIIIWGVYLITAGELTMGGLIACNILVGRSMAPLGALAALLTRFQQSRVALKSLDMIMQTPSERSGHEDRIEHKDLEPSITFKEVTFQYPNTQTRSLNRAGFSIRPGEKVAVIGKMGSGKTTIARLCLGMYHPTEGNVEIGGVDIRQLDTNEIRRKIGYVPQDVYLFYGSVRDNIAFGAPWVDDQAILKAAATSGALEFIRVSPAGFQLPVGERGQYLSGGQRQSIAIARALLFDPDIVIMDEPSSSMDNGGEALLRKRLKKILAHKTLILFTHRMSMLDLVDRLIVLDDGQVIADGPKNKVIELLKKK
jgi:ATP-binding cassette subfamily C protein LapB